MTTKPRSKPATQSRVPKVGSHKPLVDFDAKGKITHSRYRTFVVTSGMTTIWTYGGIDVKPEDVISRREEYFRNHVAETQPSPGRCPEWGDETVWEGDQIIAVLRFAYEWGGDKPMEGWMTAFRFDDSLNFDPYLYYATKRSEMIGATRGESRKHGTEIGPKVDAVDDDDDEDEDEGE